MDSRERVSLALSHQEPDRVPRDFWATAETVLASHGKVSDRAASQLMTEFMRRWREAQLTLLRSKGFSNPCFRAAFTLTGQWD